MKLITTDLGKYRANLYIGFACSMELAEELITDIDTADTDVRIIGALKNVGIKDDVVRRVVGSCRSAEFIDGSKLGHIDYDAVNERIKSGQQFDVLMNGSLSEIVRVFGRENFNSHVR